MNDLKCPDHPKYKALRAPRANCTVCRCLWSLAGARKWVQTWEMVVKHAIKDRLSGKEPVTHMEAKSCVKYTDGAKS